MMRVFADRDLFSDLLQSFAYFSFVGGLFTIALPLIRANKINAVPFIVLFLLLMSLTYLFTLAHVLRPSVKKYFPKFGLRGIDPEPIIHSWPASFVFAALAVAIALCGLYIVQLGMAA